MFNDFALYNTTSVIPAKVLSLNGGLWHRQKMRIV